MNNKKASIALLLTFKIKNITYNTRHLWETLAACNLLNLPTI